MPFDPASLLNLRRRRIAAVVALFAITAAVWATASVRSTVVDDAIARGRAADRMLSAMLDQQAALRGYLQTGDDQFVEPYAGGAADFTVAAATVRRDANPGLRRSIDAEIAAAIAWQQRATPLMQDQLPTVAEPAAPADGAAGPAGSAPAVIDPSNRQSVAERKELFDTFRAAHTRTQSELSGAIERDLRNVEIMISALVLGMALLTGLLAHWGIERHAARLRHREQQQAAYRETQRDFARAMHVMSDEDEAHLLVGEHLERTVAGTSVTVLTRNDVPGGLVAKTPVHDRELAERLAGAAGDSCAAVRSGRPSEQDGTPQSLACILCDGRRVTCVPSIVRGEVVGAVRVERDRPLDDTERQRIDDTVRDSAAVLANLHNLAVAEHNAATDALTRLPNARSCQEMLARMVAQAGRAVAPLSAVMVDLDHFKAINDDFGHAAGDAVLAAVGVALRGTVRDSDFAGRYGGEEFLLLLPNTDTMGARMVAEKVRASIKRISLPGVPLSISASFGVATHPDDARTGDALLQQADRALYAAKRAGRDRVEVARVTPDIDFEPLSVDDR